VIVVLGRPTLDELGRLGRLAGRIAAAAAASGASVELAGSVADDSDGDSVIVELGREGIGHAALLRVPARAAARLDSADIELSLRYLTECRVLVIADTLDGPALDAAVDGARYHAAKLVVAGAGESMGSPELPADATVLAAPEEDDGAFALLVGRYAAQLDAGHSAADAWRDAVSETGWEQSEATESAE
jgi:hypothetical protein